jgi:hypothetical protein
MCTRIHIEAVQLSPHVCRFRNRPAMRRAALRPLIAPLAAGTAGLVLQWTATGGLALIWPGRIATLLVAILLGPWYGVAATSLALSPKVAEPALLIVCLLEAARRRLCLLDRQCHRLSRRQRRRHRAARSHPGIHRLARQLDRVAGLLAIARTRHDAPASAHRNLSTLQSDIRPRHRRRQPRMVIETTKKTGARADIGGSRPDHRVDRPCDGRRSAALPAVRHGRLRVEADQCQGSIRRDQ